MSLSSLDAFFFWGLSSSSCTQLDGVHPQARECTVQPFKGTRCIPRSVIPGGTNNGNDISGRLLMMQVLPSCHN